MDQEITELLGTAEEAVRAGRKAAAKEAWEKVRVQMPDQPVALNGLGMLAMEEGRPAEAMGLFRNAAEAEPGASVLWLNHAVAARALGDAGAERESLLRAVELDPRSLLIHVRLAENAERTGELAEAGRAWSVVLSLADSLADIPPDARPAINHARRFLSRQNAALEVRIDEHLEPLRQKIAPGDRRRIEAAIAHMLGKRTIYLNQCSGLHVPFLPADEFFDREQIPWIGQLESATDVIRDELTTVLRGGGEGFEPYVALPRGTPANVWTSLDGSMDWSTLHLWRHGQRDDEACRRFPRTAAVLDALPLARLPGRMPTVFFSVLAPKAHIPPHTGVSNTRAIVHLPLIVPAGCRFRVGGETRSWAEGEAMIFDDTIEHEAWNDSDQPRVVLILDTWNPHLTQDEQQLLQQFHVMGADDLVMSTLMQ